MKSPLQDQTLASLAYRESAITTQPLFDFVPDIFLEEEEGTDGQSVARPSGTRRSIRVIRTTAEGVQEEVRYCALDRSTQREVLVDLLVKSAVHFALITQEKINEDCIAEAIRGQESNDAEPQNAAGPKVLPVFDMREAVESLLDSQRDRPFILGGADLPEIDGSPRGSEHCLLSKRPSLAFPRVKPHAGRQRSRCTSTTSEGGEFPEEGPVTTSRKMSTDTSSLSSVPQLPAISKSQPLSPIKDVSRETSQLLALPALTKEDREEDGAPSVHVMPATPQHSTLTALPTLRQHHPHHHHHHYHQNDPEREQACISEASGYNMSSDSSVVADPSLIFGQRSSRRSKTKGSPRQRGAKSQSGSTVESPSLRGSMVMAPDGEIINVGGSIAPPRQHDVGVLRDVTSQLRLYEVSGGMMTDDSGLSDEEGGEWKGSDKGRKPKSTSSPEAEPAKKPVDNDAPSVTEQAILDTLTEQAKQIADALLAKDGAGTDLERDVREAADLWMESHPAHDVSHHEAVQDALKSGALEELMAAYRDSSADPTAAQYRQLIRQSLTTAVATAAGLSPDQIPEDLEISPDLLEALANQKLSPSDITIVYDEETGRPVVRSRQEMAQTVAENEHAALSSDGQDLGGTVDGDSLMNNTTYDAIHPEEPEPLVDGVPHAAAYDLKAVEKTDIPSALLTHPDDSKRTDKPVKSGDVFGAGAVDLKADLPTKVTAATTSEGKSKKTKKEGKKKGKKGKKGKKDEESAQDTEEDSSALTKAKAVAMSSSDEPLSPRSPTPDSFFDRALQSSPEAGKSDEDAEFGMSERNKGLKGESSSPQKPSTPLPFPDDDDEEEEDEDSEEKSLANREARAARREAAAARRKEEVERRRREREEQLKLTKGQLERQEQLRREMEIERLKREEEKILRKLQEKEDAEREEREQEEERRRRMLEEEREREAKEEHQRRLEEMRREQMEEEERRNALLLAKEREEERRRAEEELMLSQMAEQERLEYERRKREEEEARRRKEEEDRRQREEEAQRAMEEARRLAEEMARKQAALEAKLRFNRSVRREARNLGHSQEISRAFVFSYFKLMQWLGLDIPQFELGKMRRY